MFQEAENLNTGPDITTAPKPNKQHLFGQAPGATDVWSTPQDFFDKVNEVFDFNLDVCALPARTDVGWWQDHCLGREIHYIRGRLKFGGSKSNAPFGCALVVFRPSLRDVFGEQ